MDARLPPSISLKWPVHDVLYPKKLSDKKIGVFGWIGNQLEKKYIPLKVTSRMFQDKKNKKQIYVYLRASVDVMNVRWRFAQLSSNNFCSKAGKWIKTKKRVFNEGTRILCKIPENIKGPICIKVRADAMNSDEPLLCEAKILF